MAGERRSLLVSRVWVQATLLVVVCGFFILGLLAYRTYMAHPPVPKRVVDSQGRVLYTGKDISEGPAGLPAQRAHGVRLGVRPRRVSRARLHRRLPAPLLRSRQALLRWSRVGLRRAQDDRGLPHQPLRRADEDPDADRCRRPTPSAASSRTTAASSPTRRPSTACAPTRSPIPHAAAPADRVLRLDGVGGVDQPPGPRLLLHQQLAARAARRQQADRQRDRLVGAVADRAARRHRPALRRLRPLGTQPGLARSRTGDALASARRATSR